MLEVSLTSLRESGGIEENLVKKFDSQSFFDIEKRFIDVSCENYVVLKM